MRALVWANSGGAAIFGALVPVVWIRPGILNVVIAWCWPAALAVGGISWLATVGHLRYRQLRLEREPGPPRGWLSVVGWHQISALLEGVPHRGVALGLSSCVVAWLIASAAVVAEMTALPGPELAVLFVAVPAFVHAAMALFVAAAKAERDRRMVAPDSWHGVYTVRRLPPST